MTCTKNGAQISNTSIVSNNKPVVDFYFVRAPNAPTDVAVQPVVDSKSITVTNAAAAGIVIGSYFGVFGGGRYFFAVALNVVGNVITTDTPVDFAFPIGSTAVYLDRDLNKDGSVTPLTYSILGPTAGNITFHVTRFMLMAECATAVDLSKFGDLGALTNGMILRQSNGVSRTIWNIKKNSGFALHAYDWTPFAATNPQQGVDGMIVRYSFNGPDKHDSPIILQAGESLDLIVQDNLLGLTTFQALAEGREG